MAAYGRHFTDLIFLTDFDGTCSLEDTTDVLVQLAPYPNNASYINLLGILSQSIEDCLSFQIPHSCAFDWGFHHSHLRNLLRKLEDFGKEFNQQVMDQQLLKGICREEIRVAAKKVPLRAGCIEFLLKLATSDTSIHVISKQKKMVVYIGDSMNDILPMLGADIGIIIGTNKTVKKILSLFKIQVDPLEVAATEVRSKKATSFRHTGRLFKVAAWAEVEACLSKLLPL